MITKYTSSIRRLGALGAAAAVASGLLLLSAPSASAATVDAFHRIPAGTHAVADSSSMNLPPAYVGSVYTGRIGPAGTFSPQFAGPVPTPSNPNPPTQYVHITAGSAGASVAKSVTLGAPFWSTPWTLGPNESVVIPVQCLEMVGIADSASGTPGSFTVTSITSTP